jgi:hypothetical protein
MILIDIAVEKMSVRCDFPLRHRVINRIKHDSVGIEDSEPFLGGKLVQAQRQITAKVFIFLDPLCAIAFLVLSAHPEIEAVVSDRSKPITCALESELTTFEQVLTAVAQQLVGPRDIRF